MERLVSILVKDFFIRRMIFFNSVLVFCISLSWVFSIKVTSTTEVDTVELLCFYSEECDHCQHVDEFVLEPLIETYPIRVVRVCIDGDEGGEAEKVYPGRPDRRLCHLRPRACLHGLGLSSNHHIRQPYERHEVAHTYVSPPL